MTKHWFLAVFACLSLLAVSAHAATAAPATAPATPSATAPAGSTGVCKDGSFSTAAEKKGACRGHKGIQDWYASTSTPTSTAAPASAAAGAKSVAAAGTGTRTTSSAAMPSQAAPGGGPGMVWVNTKSKVYHCQTDKWYGKTKAGEYLSEANAKAKGFHAEHGKACAA